MVLSQLKRFGVDLRCVGPRLALSSGTKAFPEAKIISMIFYMRIAAWNVTRLKHNIMSTFLLTNLDTSNWTFQFETHILGLKNEIR